MIRGTQAKLIIEVLHRIPARHCFTKPDKVIVRFPVQQLHFDALQEVRIELRWDRSEPEKFRGITAGVVAEWRYAKAGNIQRGTGCGILPD
jgi:hypothetical protein